MSTRATGNRPARDRLLDAASELFYERGVHTAGIDTIIERAGVAKATLYSAFGSKEELIRAYLQRRHERRQERITRGLERYDNPRDPIEVRRWRSGLSSRRAVPRLRPTRPSRQPAREIFDGRGPLVRLGHRVLR